MREDEIGEKELARAEDELIHGLIEEARRGDRDIARNLLWQFRLLVECEEPLPPHLLKYLSACFHRILDEGEPADKALNIQGLAYRPQPRGTREQDRAVAQMVAMRTGNDHHSGALERAKDWVVKETGCVRSQVDHAYDKYRGELLAFHQEYGIWPLIMRPPKQ